MAVNKFFHSSNLTAIASEQTLYSNIVSEAIVHRGHSVYYIDRTLVAEDTVLGEDALSKFDTKFSIEMYMENESGFGGEREIMSQFGLQNLSEATFVVSKTKFDAATDAARPFEGDAIYHPILKKLFQINFVDHDEPFHQLDSNPVYKLKCRLFDYGSETINTGISEIDAIQDSLSISSSDYQLTLEQTAAVTINQEIRIDHAAINGSGLLLDETDGDNIIGENENLGGESILLETGGVEYIIQEDYVVGDGVIDKTSQNDLFETLDDDILDFSESNPFGDAGRSN